MMYVKANDLKKGDKVVMRDGFVAVLRDSVKGNIRSVEMQIGYVKEMGSIYVWDVAEVVELAGKEVQAKVLLSDAQIRSRKAVRAAGF